MANASEAHGKFILYISEVYYVYAYIGAKHKCKHCTLKTQGCTIQFVFYVGRQLNV